VITADEARRALAAYLRHDAGAHDRQSYDEIGRRFDSFEHGFPSGDDPKLETLRIALTFWDGWIDARNNGWQTTSGIRQDEWPALARGIADDVDADREITSDSVHQHFGTAGRSVLTDRVQSLADRLRERSRAP
jgi:hypothetical protein